MIIMVNNDNNGDNNGYLVGGFNHVEKYEFVNGKDNIPYMKWKIKKFEATNQITMILKMN